MATIASILVDGQDPNMPALRAWLATLSASVAAAAGGFRTFENVTALNGYTPAAGEPTYAFVKSPKFAAYKFNGSLPWAIDPTYFEGVAAAVQAELDQAEAKANYALSATIPLGKATVTSNTAALTQYTVTLPTGFNANTDAQPFSFIVPATALGATVRLGVVGAAAVYDVSFAAAEQLRAGWTAYFVVNRAGNKYTIIGRGSSVVTDVNAGRAGAAPAGLAPVAYLASNLQNRRINTIWTARNFSKGGTVQSQARDQYDEAISASAAVPLMVFDGFGMNDMQMSSYNAGQLSPEFFGNPIYYEAELRDLLDNKGVYYYMACTSPHDNTDAQTNTIGGNAMQWPYQKDAPVADDELVPPFNGTTPAQNRSVTPAKDWTGRGILRLGNARGEHVNELMRSVLRKLHNDPKYRGRIFLLDCEWAWFRYGVEQYTLAQLFNAGETVHMNALGHQVTYQRCIREFVAASRRGFGDQWVFRGELAA